MAPRSLFLLMMMCYPFFGSAQNTADSTQNGLINKFKENSLSQKALRSVVRKPEADTVFNFRSEEGFMPYEGKIIRKIIVETLHFSRGVQDTTKVVRNLLIGIGERVHTDTRERIIRNNLFIREGTPLNPYRLADNERYLRDLEFIKDSRIFVIMHHEEADTVDLLVITRDVFSLGASIEPSSLTAYEVRVQEANFLGNGQKFEWLGDYNPSTHPTLNGEWFTRKTNVLGSFINAELGFTNLNNGRSVGNEYESAQFFRLDRPLYMPYARWAGGLELSKNQSLNIYQRPDSIYANYTYNITDVWSGFTFGVNRPKGRLENRNRKFLAARVLNQHFTRLPSIPLTETQQLLYGDRVLVLGQLTFFRQDFYKTKYVYGFGRTEDIPYGYNLSYTAGLERQQTLTRAYAGVDLARSLTNKNGNIINLNGRLAGYAHGSIEDVLVTMSASYFSRVYETPHMLVRHFAEFGYSRYFNRTIKNPLNVNGANGIEAFRNDTIQGDALLRARFQVLVFTKWKLLGFNFAVVPQVDLAFLGAARQSVFLGPFVKGYSLGIRTRNENLIFNTIELRGYYFPQTYGFADHFRLVIRSNLRIKYPTTLVKGPSTVFDP